MKNDIENVLGKVIEIEDYDGNTIMAIMIDKNGEIIKYLDCEIADSDSDYLFDSDKTLIRLQKTEK